MNKIIKILVVLLLLSACSSIKETGNISKNIDMKEYVELKLTNTSNNELSKGYPKYYIALKTQNINKLLVDDYELLNNLKESAISKGNDNAVAELSNKISTFRRFYTNGLQVWLRNETRNEKYAGYCDEGNIIVVETTFDEDTAKRLGYSFNNTKFKIQIINGEIVYK